jgi:hypothetical protein
MSTPTPPLSFLKDQSDTPLIHLSYECVLQERERESDFYIYEIACSITYPVASGHLSIRVAGQNTYRKSATREIPFTSHEAGATTYLELFEAEQLEVRIIAYEGAYGKAIYTARKRTLSEQYARGVLSRIDQISV